MELARARALVHTPAQVQALAGVRDTPALADGELVEAQSSDIGEVAPAGAGGAPALATGGEEEFVVAGRAIAPLPQARQGGNQEDGWLAILGLGAQSSFYCRARLLQEVPHQHLSAHARGWAAVLRRWDNATTEEEKMVALLWLGFLPQCLQRTPF